MPEPAPLKICLRLSWNGEFPTGKQEYLDYLEDEQEDAELVVACLKEEIHEPGGTNQVDTSRL